MRLLMQLLEAIKESPTPHSVLSNYLIAFITLLLALIAGLQTCQSQRMIGLSQDTVKIAQEQIAIAKDQTEIARKQYQLATTQTDLLVKAYFPKIQINVIMTTDFLRAEANKELGCVFSSSQWNRYGEGTSFSLNLENIGKERVNEKFAFEYVVYAYEDIRDRPIHYFGVEDTLNFDALPGVIRGYDVTKQLNQAMAVLSIKHYGGSFPDNLAMEVAIGKAIQVVGKDDKIKRNINYVVGKVGK